MTLNNAQLDNTTDRKQQHQQQGCFIQSNPDEFMKVMPTSKAAIQTSVLNENGEWVLISTETTTSSEDDDDDDLSVNSNGSSVQFDEHGRPLSYNSLFDSNDDGNDEEEDEHDDDEEVECCDETATTKATAMTHDDDDSCSSSSSSSRIGGFDEKAYTAHIEAEIAKEENLAAERFKVRTEQQRIAKVQEEAEHQQRMERRESLMASKQKEAQRLAEAAANLQRMAIEAEKELAEAECVAAAAEAAHVAMVSASLSKSFNQRMETMKNNPIQKARISKIVSQQESDSFEMAKSKVQHDVAEKVQSKRLSEEYKQQKWVSQTSPQEQIEAEMARNWGRSPIEGMSSSSSSSSRRCGSPKKTSSLPSVSRNQRKKQQQQQHRPRKSLSLQEGKGGWVSIGL